MAGNTVLNSIARPDATATEVAEALVQLDAVGDVLGALALGRVGITRLVEGAQPTLMLVPGERQAWLGGRCVVALKRSKLLYKLFETIAIHGRTTDRSELYERVWELPYREPHSDNSLYVALNRLRKQLDGIEIEALTESRYALGQPYGVVSWTPVSGASTTGVRHNLMARPDALVGRAQELSAIAEAFAAGARLITLRGPGGAGKTRLATEYGSGLVDSAPGDIGTVWFCDLTNAREISEVLSQVARDVGLAASAWKDSDAGIAQLGSHLDSHAPVLLILDNLEQVVSLTPDTIGVWLDQVPGLRVLATSRERLRLPGEHVIVVGPLGLPHQSSVDDVAASAAVSLFVERAGAIASGFSLTPDNAQDVRAIVEVLDGLPLAIELAAARVAFMTPKHLAERLAQAVDDPLNPSPSYDGLMTADRRGASAKTAALRGSIAWSWNLLETWEQAAMRQLSVFRGGFFLESAEAVLDLADPAAPRPMAVIGTLVDQSLLQSRMVGGRLRFDMLTSIREYAAEQVQSDGPSPAHIRHAHHFSGLGEIEHLESVRIGTAEDWQYLAIEIENLRAGVEVALVAEDHAAAGCAIAALAILTISGPFNPALLPMPDVLAIAGLPLAVLSRLERSYGVLLYFGAGREEALAAIGRSVQLARDAQSPGDLAWALGTLGVIRKTQGRIDESMALYVEAQELHRQVGSRRGLGQTIANIASLYRIRGETEKARQMYMEALIEHRAVGDSRDEAATLGLLSIMDRDAGRHAQARTRLESALALYGQNSDTHRQGFCLVGLGGLDLVEGHLAQAQGTLKLALDRFQQVGAQMDAALVLGDLGEVALAQGDLGRAEARLLEGIRLMQRLDSSAGLMHAHLGRVRLRQGALDAAGDLFSRAQAEIGDAHPAELGVVLCFSAELADQQGRVDAADALLGRAQEIADSQDLGPSTALRRLIAEVCSAR